MADTGLYNTDFVKAIRKNKRNCFYLVTVLVLIMALLGYLLGAFMEYQDLRAYSLYSTARSFSDVIFTISNWGLTCALVAMCVAILWSACAVLFGKKIILFSSQAKQIDLNDQEYQVLNNVVEELAIASGIKIPQVYVIETEALNAFATGMSPDNAAVAITRGLLEQLNRDELQGVIAHEMGHIINYDIRYQTLVSVIVGLIIVMSDMCRRIVFHSSYGNLRRSNNNNSNSKNNSALIFGIILLVFSIVAPIAAIIIQMAVSRQREYLADATSVKLTRNPLGLISALNKLEQNTKTFEGATRANQNLFIVNPFKNVAKIKNNLFSTHPQIAARVERLRDLGGK